MPALIDKDWRPFTINYNGQHGITAVTMEDGSEVLEADCRSPEEGTRVSRVELFDKLLLTLSAVLLAPLAACQAAAVAPAAPIDRGARLRAQFPPSICVRDCGKPGAVATGAGFGLGAASCAIRAGDARYATSQRVPMRTGDRGRRTFAVGTTIGAPGWTETVSCDGLEQSGLVTGPDGADRLVLIYATHSPNADGQTAVVLTRGSAGWNVDENATERLSESSEPPSLTRIKREFEEGRTRQLNNERSIRAPLGRDRNFQP